ncbi:MAG: metal ABC transporter substrate-binding protein [Myxococcota bacterium]
MFHLLKALGLFLALLLPSGAHALDVVATTEDVASIAREVLGKDGKVTTLASSFQDPHFVDARPSLLVPMSRADALVLVGLDLEVGWLPVLLTGARNNSILMGAPGYIDASQFIQPMDVPTTPVDRSQGDIHPRGNPHYLKDPYNAARVARGLAQRFINLAPEKAEQFTARAEAFAKLVEEKAKQWETRLAGLKGMGVVTYHRSLNYLARWLQLDMVGYVEPRPGVPPTPVHVVQLISLSRARKVKLFLIEGWFPSATAQVVAEKAGGKLTVLPGLPKPDQSYVDHMEEVVSTLEKAAGK